MLLADNLFPRQLKNVPAKTLDGETVILKIEDRGCYLLNRNATYLWQLADGKHSVKELIDRFTKKYRIKKSLAQKHTKELLCTLGKKGLIRFTEAKKGR